MKTRDLPLTVALVLALAAAPGLRAQDTSTPSPSTATTPIASTGTSHIDPAEVAADAVIVRPVGLAATVVGGAVFLLALPFAAIAGDVNKTANALVGAPARYTFKRPLGDFEVRHP